MGLSGDGLVLAVGAYGNDNGGTDAGHVRVYGWVAEANAWGRARPAAPRPPTSPRDGMTAYQTNGMALS